MKDNTFWSFYPYDVQSSDTYLQDMSIFEDSSNLAVTGYDKTTNQVVLTFRGSSNIENWIENAHFIKVSYTEHGCSNCEVHEGFLDSYNTLKDQVKDSIVSLMAKYSGADLLITGHSLGSAQSQFAALDFTFMGYKLNFFSYGSPRVGTEDFTRFFNSAMKGTNLRCVFMDDPVPDLPQHFMGFEHVGTEVHFLDCYNYLKYAQYKDDYALMDLRNVDDHLSYPCMRGDSTEEELLFQ